MDDLPPHIGPGIVPFARFEKNPDHTAVWGVFPPCIYPSAVSVLGNLPGYYIRSEPASQPGNVGSRITAVFMCTIKTPAESILRYQTATGCAVNNFRLCHIALMNDRAALGSFELRFSVAICVSNVLCSF